jgi:hypothetical protein
MVYHGRFKLDHDFKRLCLAYDPGVRLVLRWNDWQKVGHIPSTLVWHHCLDHYVSGTYHMFHASLIVVVPLGIFTHVFPNCVTFYR